MSKILALDKGLSIELSKKLVLQNISVLEYERSCMLCVCKKEQVHKEARSSDQNISEALVLVCCVESSIG